MLFELMLKMGKVKMHHSKINDIMTIRVCSAVPLRCFQLLYFILFPPCCF